MRVEQYELLKVKYERAKKIYTAAMRLSQTFPLKVRIPSLLSTPLKRKRPSLKWKLDLSTSNDEIDDQNIALERIKEL